MFDRPIRFAAKLDPLAIAVSNGAEHVNYRALDRSIDQVATALEAAGVGQGALTAICLRDPYMHLLLILGCARIGAVTVSLLPEMAAPMIALALPDKVLADQAALSPDIVTDADWLQQALTADHSERPLVRLDPAALARVQFSSGTTGEPKPVGMSWDLMERRIAHTWTRPGGFDRMLSLVGPESGSLPLFLWTWGRGGCVLFGPSDPAALAAALPVLRPTGLLAAPSQLAVLLDALPDGLPSLPDLHVAIAGARASADLCRRAATVLGRVSVTYASTEAGVTTLGFAAALPDDGAVGQVTPWSEVEIVAADGQSCLAGEAGRIRIRGVDVVDRYLGQGDNPDDRFHDGWFYPGDIGAMDADGLLQVLGREDEVMNLGGEKVLPEALEDRVRRVPGVAYVAAFALADGHGVDQPWLAVVKAGETEPANGAIGQALGDLALPAVRIAWIDAIPRGPLGKVSRETLRAGARKLQA